MWPRRPKEVWICLCVCVQTLPRNCLYPHSVSSAFSNFLLLIVLSFSQMLKISQITKNNIVDNDDWIVWQNLFQQRIVSYMSSKNNLLGEKLDTRQMFLVIKVKICIRAKKDSSNLEMLTSRWQK